jgi:hypothetical protein
MFGARNFAETILCMIISEILELPGITINNATGGRIVLRTIQLNMKIKHRFYQKYEVMWVI